MFYGLSYTTILVYETYTYTKLLSCENTLHSPQAVSNLSVQQYIFLLLLLHLQLYFRLVTAIFLF